jgi:hypothetical protein
MPYATMNTLSSREKFHRVLSEATKQFDHYKSVADPRTFRMSSVLVAIGDDMRNGTVTDDAWRTEATRLLMDAGLELTL